MHSLKSCWLSSLLLLVASLPLCLSSRAIEVRKCCDTSSLLVQSSLAHRSCRSRTDLRSQTSQTLPKWTPSFHDLSSERQVGRPDSYVLHIGLPECVGNTNIFPIYHHPMTHDRMMLLANGSLAHKLVHGEEVHSQMRVYTANSYCVDHMVVFNEKLEQKEAAGIYDFAYICVKPPHQMSLQRVMDEVVYPLGLLLSVLCVLFTFLLYAFLPQLRDLTGKFILAICLCLASVFLLRLLNIFAWTHPALNRVVSDFLLHTSLLCMWLVVCCMGHHVWLIIRARSVFTRVTDGRRLLYYSIFTLTTLLVILALAMALEAFSDNDTLAMGPVVKAAFVLPMCVCVGSNFTFYCTAYRVVRREMMFNRAMQHFQVNFDLFTKLLIVLSVWWLSNLPSLLFSSSSSSSSLLSWTSWSMLLVYSSRLLDVFVGPLIFCVTLCRARVAFLFKRYFCLDCCCREADLIEHQRPYELSIINDMAPRREEQDALLNCNKNNLELETNEVMEGLISSKSLFNVRMSHDLGAVSEPIDNQLPVGRVKRLLKSNSLNAVANLNFGWRKETAV